MNPILIIGKGGQMARALGDELGQRAVSFGLPELNMNDANFIPTLDALTEGKEFSAVINAAAYTQVDNAEGEGRDEAFRVNATAVGELAAWCKARKIPLVHYSTDYVFDGSGDKPRREDVTPAPLGAYGQSKLEGEKAAAVGDHLILRTSWIYDAHGKNFFNTMLRLFAEKESLNVVNDQVGAPTYAPHLSKATLEALSKAESMVKFPSGVYHLCGGGETSWHGFAQAIFALARSPDSSQKSPVKCQRINPVPSSAYPLPAKRPLNSRLDCSKARDTFGVVLPAWEDGLKECFAEKYGNNGRSHCGSQDRAAERAGR